MTNRKFPARNVKERIYVQADLVFESAVRFGDPGSGLIHEDEILRDSETGRPMIAGSSIAGAMRAYLRDVELGYWQSVNPAVPCRAQKLFGYVSEEDENPASVMSWLIVDNALCKENTAIRTRDGVAIDSKTRAGVEKQKFNHDMLPVGTCFKVAFEAQIPDGKEGEVALESFALALLGFQNGEIPLGFRKQRGSGACRMQNWRVKKLDMYTFQDAAVWIQGDEGDWKEAVEGQGITDLLLGGNQTSLQDARRSLHLQIYLDIHDSFLIRSSGTKPNDPDAVSLADDQDRPILSGWSLAGALRHRAKKILNTLNISGTEDMVDNMFGPHQEGDIKKVPRGSRLLTKETYIKNPIDIVQPRIQIDRFTGSAMRQHLFREQPLTGGEVLVDLTLKNPQDAEVGLLLLLLKDLWLGDLPLGGEASVGRGRLRGKLASLDYDGHHWKICSEDGKLNIQGAEKMQEMVDALCTPKEVNDGRK